MSYASLPRALRRKCNSFLTAFGLAMMVGACSDQMGDFLDHPDEESDASVAPRGDDGGRSVGTSTGGGSEGGATTKDGSPPPSPTPDAGGGTPSSVPSQAKLFDDFESYAGGSTPSGEWTIRSAGSGVATIDDTRAFRGKRSLKMHVAKLSQDSSALLQTKSGKLFPAPGNAFFGRAMIFMPQVPGNRHWTFVRGSGPSLPGEASATLINYGFGVNNGAFWQAEYFKPAGFVDYGYQDFNNLTPVPASKWICVEWSFDAPQRKLRYWIDGAPVASVSVDQQGYSNQSTWFGPAFDTAQIGIDSYNPGTEFDTDLYVDDVAFGHARIGCP